MSDETALQKLKDKLARALRSKAVLTERSKLLAQQVEDLQHRESQTDHIVTELLDRQREMNFMLYRANTVLHRIQEANAMLSTEFTELVKELPAPQSPEWDDKVSKINDLFKRTGDLTDEVQDEIFHRGMGGDRPAVQKPVEKPKVPTVTAAPVDDNVTETADPEPEPVVVEEQKPELIIPTVEAELVIEPENEEASSVDQEPAEIDRDVQDRLERLFGQTLGDEDDQTDAQKSEKQGVLSKVWNKVRGKQKPPTIEPEVLPEQEKEQETVELCIVTEPGTDKSDAFSDLLNDACNEMEILSLEVVPGGASDELTIEDTPAVAQSERKQPFWAQLRDRVTRERCRRALVMVERVEARRLNRKNRRLRIPKPGDHAASA